MFAFLPKESLRQKTTLPVKEAQEISGLRWALSFIQLTDKEYFVSCFLFSSSVYHLRKDYRYSNQYFKLFKILS